MSGRAASRRPFGMRRIAVRHSDAGREQLKAGITGVAPWLRTPPAACVPRDPSATLRPFRTLTNRGLNGVGSPHLRTRAFIR